MKVTGEKPVDDFLPTGLRTSSMIIEVQTENDTLKIEVEPSQVIHEALAEALECDATDLTNVCFSEEVIPGSTFQELGIDDGGRISVGSFRRLEPTAASGKCRVPGDDASITLAEDGTYESSTYYEDGSPENYTTSQWEKGKYNLVPTKWVVEDTLGRSSPLYELERYDIQRKRYEDEGDSYDWTAFDEPMFEMRHRLFISGNEVGHRRLSGEVTTVLADLTVRKLNEAEDGCESFSVVTTDKWQPAWVTEEPQPRRLL